MLLKKKQTEISTAATAFSGLLQRFGLESNEAELNTLLQPENGDIWHLITNFDDNIQVIEVGELGTWPRTNDAIVKFTYRSLDQPNINDEEGNLKPNYIDLYCLMADWTNQEILDPTDGLVKNAGYYGQPVGWASYECETELVKPASLKKNKGKNEFSYTVSEGENVWEIARKLNVDVVGLIEGNGIDDPHKVPAGSVLLIPRSKPKEVVEVRYEVLDRVRKMHVIKAEGAKKWAFGNVKKWDDLKPTGPTYAPNTNLEIVAIAHVPIGEDTAAFYMDSMSFGNFRDSGQVAWQTGFNWQHLENGYVERPKVRPHPVAQPVQNTATVEDIKLATAKTNEVDTDGSKPKPSPNAYKATFRPLNEQRLEKVYLFAENLMVHEMDGRANSKAVYKHEGVAIFGTFEKDGVVYGRPTDSIDSGYWFGIPMDKLIDEEELYNTAVDLQTKIELKHGLTLQEKGVVVLSKVLSQGTKIAAIFKTKKEQ